MRKNISNKKSQGISVNVIIIAAIALIVLVVLIAVFTGRFGLFSKGLNECHGDPQYESCKEGYVNYPGTDHNYCCIDIGGGKSATIEEPRKASEPIT